MAVDLPACQLPHGLAQRVGVQVKKGARPPIHVRTARTLRREMEKHLDQEHDEIVDIHFRLEASEHGPPGWNVIVKRTLLGQSSTHGINFGAVSSPSAKQVGDAARTAVEQLESAVTRSQLVVKPGDTNKVIGRG